MARTPVNGEDQEVGRLWNELNSHFRSGDFESALAAIAKAPEDLRPILYQQVASRTAGKGDIDRARQIIKDKITNPSQQSRMLAHIERPTPERLLAQGNLEGARQLLSQTDTAEDRAVKLARLATVAAGKADNKTALQLLEEARGLVTGQTMNNAARFNTQLEIARAYALIEPERSFEVVEPLVDKLNELVSAAAALDGFLPAQRSFKDDELILQQGFISKTYLRPYAELVASLARTDFNRSQALAYRFQATEMRVMALLLVAQSVLSTDGRPMPSSSSRLPQQ